MHCWWAARTMSLRWLEETGTTTGWVTADVCVRWWISSIVSLVRCTIKITKIYFSKNRFEKEFSFPVIRAIPRNVQRYYLLAADHHLGNFWRSSARIITITLCITRQIIHTFVEPAMSSLAIITNICWKHVNRSTRWKGIVASTNGSS